MQLPEQQNTVFRNVFGNAARRASILALRMERAAYRTRYIRRRWRGSVDSSACLVNFGHSVIKKERIIQPSDGSGILDFAPFIHPGQVRAVKAVGSHKSGGSRVKVLGEYELRV